MRVSRLSALRMMDARLPQANMALKNPAISMSCLAVYRCGMEMGSVSINDTCSYRAAAWFNRTRIDSFKTAYPETVNYADEYESR